MAFWLPARPFLFVQGASLVDCFSSGPFFPLVALVFSVLNDTSLSNLYGVVLSPYRGSFLLLFFFFLEPKRSHSHSILGFSLSGA